MAGITNPDEVLRSTTGKTNFQRLARLLICGGTTLLREMFDQLCPPSNLPTILKNPATEKQLKAAKLTKPQRDCLYPSPGVYGKSEDFDITLLFRLLSTICNLIPPVTGWDALPTSTDLCLAADLARIKHYRNSVYGHVNQNMEITDEEFPLLWQEITEVLVRAAGQISHTKKTEWQGAIDDLLKDPLTAEDERNVQELQGWYENDTEIKKSMDELKITTQKGIDRLETRIDRLETSLKAVQGGLEGKTLEIETAVREESQTIKDKLEEKLKTTTLEVQKGLETSLKGIQGGLEGKTLEIETAVREESQTIKDKLEEVHQSINKLNSKAEGSGSAGGRLKWLFVSPVNHCFEFPSS